MTSKHLTPLEDLTDGTPITYGVVKPGETPKDDGVPFIRGGDIKDGVIDKSSLRTITKEVSEQYKRTLLRGGELLVSLVGNPGEVALVPAELAGANLARQVGLVRLDENRVNTAYVQYYLRSPHGKGQLAANSLGSVQSVINLKELKKLEIPLPEKGVQDQVAHIFLTLDEKLQLNHQINQTLEQMAQAIFKSWFVDFEPVKAKIAASQRWHALQPIAEPASPVCYADDEVSLPDLQTYMNLAAMQAISGKDEEQLVQMQAEQPEEYAELLATAELFPSAMRESELGEIPEGWSVKPIGEILDRLKPKKRYTKKQVASVGTVPVFEQGVNIILGFHDDEPGIIATPEDPAFIFGDHTCITHLSCQSFDVSQNVIPLKGQSRPTIWTFYALQGEQKFQEYRRHWAELVVKDIIYPPVGLCEIFSESVKDLIRLKEQLIGECGSLMRVRDALLPKLLSGELSVPEIAPPGLGAREVLGV